MRARIKLTREMIRSVRFVQLDGTSIDDLAKSAKVKRRVVMGLETGNAKSISAEDWGRLYPYLERHINHPKSMPERESAGDLIVQHAKAMAFDNAFEEIMERDWRTIEMTLTEFKAFVIECLERNIYCSRAMVFKRLMDEGDARLMAYLGNSSYIKILPEKQSDSSGSEFWEIFLKFYFNGMELPLSISYRDATLVVKKYNPFAVIPAFATVRRFIYGLPKAIRKDLYERNLSSEQWKYLIDRIVRRFRVSEEALSIVSSNITGVQPKGGRS